MSYVLVIGIRESKELVYIQEVYDSRALATECIKLDDSYFELLFNTNEGCTKSVTIKYI